MDRENLSANTEQDESRGRRRADAGGEGGRGSLMSTFVICPRKPFANNDH